MTSRARETMLLAATLARVLVVAGFIDCATWASTGRVVDGRCLHVGVRPSADALDEWVVTAQVSTDAPVCREVYR